MPIYIDKTGYIEHKKQDYGMRRTVERIMQNVPLLTADGRQIAGTGKGKVVLLHKVVEQVRGSFQNYVQAIGDCVSFGWMGAAQASYASDIAFRGQLEQWHLDIATEWWYGTARYFIGNGRLGNSDGLVGSWIAKAVTEHGTLFRQPYGQHDLTTYSGQRARSWGYKNLPLELEREADKHPVSGTPPLVRTYEELRDCIANGYAVAVCSNYGFRDTRDSEGFSKKSGSWAHCLMPDAIVRGAEYKRASDVSVGDFVEGHDGLLHQVTQKIETMHIGQMAKVTATGSGPFVVTSEHPVLVYRPSASGIVFRNELPIDASLVSGGVSVSHVAIATNQTKLSYVAAKDLTKGDYLVCPRRPQNNEELLIPEWVETNGNRNPESSKICSTSDMAWVLGLYIADGYAVKSHKIVWTLGNTKDWQRAFDILEKAGWNPTLKRSESFVRIICYGASKAQSFRHWFGTSSDTKKIPGWLMTWDTASVIDGICEGDGVLARGRKIITTTSAVLLSQMFALLVDMGKSPCCLNPKMSEGYPNRKPTWTIAWTEVSSKASNCKHMQGMYCMPVRTVELFEAEQPVVNFEVEDCHSYVANNVTNHNCMYFHGVDDTTRPGALCQNSWPKSWISGPKRHDQPDGSFWVDAATVDGMLRQNDSFAIPGLNGIEKKDTGWWL